MNLALVTVDEPQGTFTSVPPIWEPRRPISRWCASTVNDENGTKKGITAAERFDDLYSEAEVLELAKEVRQLSSRSRGGARDVQRLLLRRNNKERCEFKAMV